MWVGMEGLGWSWRGTGRFGLVRWVVSVGMHRKTRHWEVEKVPHGHKWAHTEHAIYWCVCILCGMEAEGEKGGAERPSSHREVGIILTQQTNTKEHVN